MGQKKSDVTEHMLASGAVAWSLYWPTSGGRLGLASSRADLVQMVVFFLSGVCLLVGRAGSETRAGSPMDGPKPRSLAEGPGSLGSIACVRVWGDQAWVLCWAKPCPEEAADPGFLRHLSAGRVGLCQCAVNCLAWGIPVLVPADCWATEGLFCGNKL